MKLYKYFTLLFLFTTASKGSHALLHDYLSQQAKQIRHRPTRVKVLKGALCADKVAQWCESDEQFKKTSVAPMVQALVGLEGMLDEYGNLIPDAVDIATYVITTWDEGKKGCNALYMGPLQLVTRAVTTLERYQMHGAPPSSNGGQLLALGCALAAAGAACWKWSEHRERKKEATLSNGSRLEYVLNAAIAPQDGPVYRSSIEKQDTLEDGLPIRFFTEPGSQGEAICLKGPIAMCCCSPLEETSGERVFYFGQGGSCSHREELGGKSRKEAALYNSTPNLTRSFRSEAVHNCEAETCQGHSVLEQCGTDFPIPQSFQSLRKILFRRRLVRGGRLKDLYEEGQLPGAKEVFQKVAEYLGAPDPSTPEERGQSEEVCERVVLPQVDVKKIAYKRDDTALLCRLAVVDLYDGVTTQKVDEVIDLFEAAREANQKDCWSEQARQARTAFINRINEYAVQYRARRQKVWALIGLLERWKRLKQCECLAKNSEAVRKDVWYKIKPPKQPVKLGPIIPNMYQFCPAEILRRTPRGIGGRTMQLRAQINHWFFNQLSLLVMHYKEVLAVLKDEIERGGLPARMHMHVQSGDLREALRNAPPGSFYDEWVRLFGIYLAPEDVITSLTMFDSFKSCYDSWEKTKDAWTKPFHSLISEEDWQECIKEAGEVDKLARLNEYGKAFFEECKETEFNPNIQDMPTGEQVLRTAHACREGITSRVLIDMALDFVAGKKMTWLEEVASPTAVEGVAETAGASVGAGSSLREDDALQQG